MSWPIVGLGLSVGASFLQAGMQSSMAKAQAKAANEQLKIDMENERIRGMQEANARQEEYLRNESANRVVVAASGAGQSMSYDQGIAPYNKEVARRDLQTMGFNTGQAVSRMGYQIRVNKANAANASRAAWLSAGADAAGTIGGAMVDNPTLFSGGIKRAKSWFGR